MKQTVLRNYAKLIARMGVNIQKGQEVIIYCELDQPRFVEMLIPAFVTVDGEVSRNPVYCPG